MDDKAVYTHRTSWKHHSGWCRDTGRRTPTTCRAPVIHGTQGAQLPCRPPHSGAPALVRSTAPGGPSSPVVHTAWGAWLPSPAQRPWGAWLPCRPRHPGGPGSPPVHAAALQKAKPQWAPSPAGGLLPPCAGRRGVTRPGLCHSSCPFPALFPRLPLLCCFICLLPIPGWSHHLGSPLSTFTHGEQPQASRRRRPSGSICPQKAVPRRYSVLAMGNQDNQPGRQNQTAVGLTGTGRASSTLLFPFTTPCSIMKKEESLHTLLLLICSGS